MARCQLTLALTMLGVATLAAEACGSDAEQRSARNETGGEAGEGGVVAVAAAGAAQGGGPTRPGAAGAAGATSCDCNGGFSTGGAPLTEPVTRAGAGAAGDGSAAGAAGAAACGSAGTFPVGSFDDDFAHGLGAQHWSVTQTTPSLYSVDDTHGDVRLATTADNPGGLQNVDIALDLASVGGPVSGDFEASVAFSNASLAGTFTQQIELHTTFEDASYFFDVYDTSSGLNLHVWNGAINAAATTAATGGTFRIARSGTTLSGYLDDTLIWSTPWTTSRLTRVDFVLQLQPGANGPDSVRFDDFHLQGGCVSAD